MSQNIVPGTDIKIDNGYITVLDPFMMSEILVNTSCITLWTLFDLIVAFMHFNENM